MKYNIHITKTAEYDLIGAADYIEFTLKNPTVADNLLNTAEEKITELSSFPEKYVLVDDSVLSAWGIRFVVIDNHLAFYTIIGDTVFIIRFLYGRRDWNSILKLGYSLE